MPLLKSKPSIVEQAIDTAVQTPVSPEQLAKVETIKKAATKAASSETMSKADWANKDARISRQGLFQAALQSVGLLQYSQGTTLEDFLKTVEAVADRGLQYVNKQ